ncbi:MAG: TFIIB-type zinc ribbon-containing protein, partial [Haloarculaceae archaeon]
MSETTIRTYEREEQEDEGVAPEDELVCPECGGRLESDSEHGEVVCADC